ncbi:MAG: transporter component [Oscillospiraceae bacterium]|nr:transporter component [Oscillospiraceae bacterium]
MRNQTKNLVFAAIFLALAIVVPMLGHFDGQVFLPMHIPVLLCGFVCGWKYGGACGLIAPLVSAFITGMPPLFPMAICMMFELCAYGILSAILYKKLNIYDSLIGAMIGGRIVGGIASAVLMGAAGIPYGFEAFIAGAFVTALPGIIIQLIFIPVIVLVLQKAGFVKKRTA